jgi:glycosyltransferase involved in cell wall biosynthesis
MKVYIDISSLMSVSFITGIQRVVREVIIRMLLEKDFVIILLNYDDKNEVFQIVNNEKFTLFFRDDIDTAIDALTSELCLIDDIPSGAVFFDIDSVWMSILKRSYLLPKLKENGVRIAVQIYDIIPITQPQYCHQSTVFGFINYLSSNLKYADIIMVSTQSTLTAINDLTDRLKINRINGVVVPLGSDFKKTDEQIEQIDEEVAFIAKKKKYILMVGTIEPRKNHKLLLDAYDNYLIDKEINIIIAGRIGWNVNEFEKRLQAHSKFNKSIFHINGANDATIDYLYRNAFLVAFPTYNEGFGLPIIEAFERGTPVVASDIDVLKEVGGDFCQYFDPDNPKALADLILENYENEQIYYQRKRRISDYEPFTWDQSTQLMIDALNSLYDEKRIVTDN